jgi:hypothetical protein
VIYLYAVVAAPAPALSPTGHEGAPLSTVEAVGLAAVVSEHEAEIVPGEDALWRHEEIVEGLMAHTAVLPMRFGTMLADRDAVRAVLEERAERFTALLARVRGKVELGLRVLGPEEPPVPTASGAAYLGARLEARQRSEAVVAELDDALAPLAAERRLKPRPGSRMLLSAAYLVERDAVHAFAERVAALDAEHPELTLLSTGPWPPYGFTGDEEVAHGVPA